MTHLIPRRTALKWLATSTVIGAASRTKTATAATTPAHAPDSWSRTHDRVFLGGEFWANPMEDWKVADGGAECRSLGINRSVHSLTHQITHPTKGFSMSVKMSQLEVRGKDSGGGFRLGVRSELNEYRSNCFVTQGLNAGVADGQLMLGSETAPLAAGADPKKITLALTGVGSDDAVALRLEARASDTGASLGQLSHTFPAATLLGNVSLVSGYAPAGGPTSAEKTAKAAAIRGGGSRYRFASWKISGDAFTVSPAHRFGPLL